MHVSAASIWELAIKQRIGKFQGDIGEIAQAVSDSGFQPLPVSAEHAVCVASLPDHHRDPFDRILVAQAICEPLRLLTADDALLPYSDLVMRV